MNRFMNINNKPFGGYSEEVWNKMQAVEAFTESKRQLLSRGQYLYTFQIPDEGFVKFVTNNSVETVTSNYAVGFRNQFVMWAKDLK